MVKATSSDTEKKAAPHSPSAEKQVEAAAKKADKNKAKDEENGEGEAGSSTAKKPFKKPELSNDAFMKSAKHFVCKIMDGEEEVGSFNLAPRLNNTGSVGWNSNDKIVIPVAGEALNVNVSANLTVSGTKPKKGKKGSEEK